jgi:hypothetical protein
MNQPANPTLFTTTYSEKFHFNIQMNLWKLKLFPEISALIYSICLLFDSDLIGADKMIGESNFFD